MARALGSDLSISTKFAIEICSMLKKKSVADAKMMLEEVKEMKRAVPIRRFCNGVGHRKGKMGPGQFPIKASTAILKVIESAETNAQQKGLNTASLKIVHICAQRAARPMRFGRKGGVKTKRSHIEVVVQESKEDMNKKQKPEMKKEDRKEDKK